MSAHYTNRQSSGCWGCLAVLAMIAGTTAAAGCVCWQFASWLAGILGK